LVEEDDLLSEDEDELSDLLPELSDPPFFFVLLAAGL